MDGKAHPKVYEGREEGNIVRSVIENVRGTLPVCSQV